MPRIDFYFISPQGPQARFLFACRLLEKAYLQQHKIYVHLENAEKTQLLDKLLWTFREESFVPHQVANQELTSLEAPIQLGFNSSSPSSHQDVLLNLHSEVPAFHSGFNRILEIISNEPAMLAQAEAHRAIYEAKGYPISSHQLNP